MSKFKRLRILSGIIFVSTLAASQGSDLRETAPIKRDTCWPPEVTYSENGIFQLTFRTDRNNCSHMNTATYHTMAEPWISQISFMYNPNGENNKISLSAFGIGNPVGLQFLKKAPYKDFISLNIFSNSRHYCLSNDNRVDDYLAAFYDKDLIDDKVVDTIKNFVLAVHLPFKEFRYTEVITKVVIDRTKEKLAIQS